VARNAEFEIGKCVEKLMAAGCMPKVAAEVVTEVFAAGVRAAPHKDETAERRREWDREYRRKRNETKSGGSGGNRVETDVVHQLWTEGVGLLRQLGQAEKAARSNIGRWLKANDPAQIMAAIKRAHAERAGDPVPWITMALGGRNGKQSMRSTADDLIARAEEREREAGVVQGNDAFRGPESHKADRR
jgi:hypothetical protein